MQAPSLPSLDEWSKFIESTKNFFVSLLILAFGFYASASPTMDTTIKALWTEAAMSVVLIYVGGRQVKTAIRESMASK